jgi:hypothetical protein
MMAVGYPEVFSVPKQIALRWHHSNGVEAADLLTVAVRFSTTLERGSQIRWPHCCQ